MTTVIGYVLVALGAAYAGTVPTYSPVVADEASCNAMKASMNNRGTCVQVKVYAQK